MQVVVVGQEIPERPLVIAPVGFGWATIAQFVPFHPSISVRVRVPAVNWPTAKQRVLSGQSTPESSPPRSTPAPLGVGGPAMDQPATLE